MDPSPCHLCGSDIRTDFADLGPHTDEDVFDEDGYLDHLSSQGQYCLYCVHRMEKIRRD